MKERNIIIQILSSLILPIAFFVLSVDAKTLVGSRFWLGGILGLCAIILFALTLVKKEKVSCEDKKKFIFLYSALIFVLIMLFISIALLAINGFSIDENYVVYITIIALLGLLSGICITLKTDKNK